jgi:hypothetical protein
VSVSKEKRVPPAKKQRLVAASDQARQMQLTDFNTITPSAYMREKANDNATHSNQLTAKMLTWENERVSAPGRSLKIDENQSFQTSAEQ